MMERLSDVVVNHKFHKATCQVCAATELATAPERPRNQVDFVRPIAETPSRVPGTAQSLTALINSGLHAGIDAGAKTPLLK